MSSHPIDQLAETLTTAGRVVDRITADQWTLPTPCEKWTVADVTRHLVGGNLLFAALLRQSSPAPNGMVAESDLATAYARSADDLIAAFRTPGAMDTVITVPFGTIPGIVAAQLRTVEALVHGWDLARATGQPITAPDAVVEQALVFTQSKLGDIPADRRPFGPPQPAPDDAPVIDRLAARLGRRIDPSTSGNA